MKRMILLFSVVFGFTFVLSTIAQQPTVQTRSEPSTRLYVKTVPKGASIQIDKVKKGKSDQLITIPETLIPKDAKSVELTVKVFLDDRRSKQKRVKVTRGRIKRIEFQFEDEETAKKVPLFPAPKTTGKSKTRSSQLFGASHSVTSRAAPTPSSAERATTQYRSAPAYQESASRYQSARSAYPPQPAPTAYASAPRQATRATSGDYPFVRTLWQRKLRLSGKIEKIIPDPDGGFLLIHKRYSALQRKEICHFDHYGPSVEIDWSREDLLGSLSPESKRSIRPKACLRTSEGNYLFCGTENIPTLTAPKSDKPSEKGSRPTDYKPFAILISPKGEVIPWEKDPFEDRLGNSIVTATASPDGGFLIAGTHNFVQNDKTVLEMWLCRIDSSGKMLWEKALPHSNLPSSLLACGDGGYLLHGMAMKGPLPEGGWTVEKGWLCRLGEDGKLFWDVDMAVGGGLDSKTAQTDQGNFLLLNSVPDPKNPVMGTRPQIIRVSPKGEKVIVPVIGANNIYFDSNAWVLSSEGRIFIVGWNMLQNGLEKPLNDLSVGGKLFTIDPKTGKCLEVDQDLPDEIQNLQSIVSFDKETFLITSNDSVETDPKPKERVIRLTRIFREKNVSEIKTTPPALPAPSFVAPRTSVPIDANVVKLTPPKIENKYPEIPRKSRLPDVKIPAYPGITTVWEKRMTPLSEVEKIVADSQGGFLVLSKRHSAMKQSEVFHLAHYGADGTVDWQKEDLIEYAKEKRFSACLRTMDGNYLFCGTELDATVEPTKMLQTAKPFAILISSQGEIIPWEKDFFEKSTGISVSTAKLFEDRGFVLGCAKFSVLENTQNLRPNAWLCGIDTTGKPLWEKDFDLPHGNFPCDLWVCKDGGYFVLGCNMKADSDNDLVPTSNWLCRLDKDRELLWDVDLGKDGFPQELAQTSEGELLTIMNIYFDNTSDHKQKIIRVNPAGEKNAIFVTPEVIHFDSEHWLLTSTDKILAPGRKKRLEEGMNIVATNGTGSLYVLDPKTGKCLGMSLPDKIKLVDSFVSLGAGEYLVAGSEPNVAGVGAGSTPKDKKTTLIKIRFEEEIELPGVKDALRKLESTDSQATPPAINLQRSSK